MNPGGISPDSYEVASEETARTHRPQVISPSNGLRSTSQKLRDAPEPAKVDDLQIELVEK
jgi:hypothetical protein